MPVPQSAMVDQLFGQEVYVYVTDEAAARLGDGEDRWRCAVGGNDAGGILLTVTEPARDQNVFLPWSSVLAIEAA
ncbi:MAG TPA: hypothetical protein VF116_15735 [Ktedonobacterales bacterium]